MSAAHTAQLWALEHILEAGVDTDVIDEIIPIIPEDLPPRLKSRLSLALLRNALRDGSPVGITHCKLLAKIRHPRDLTDDDPVSKLYAEIFAAVILDAPDWDVFRRHRDELFPEGCPFPLASAETKLVDESRILEFPSRGRHTPTCRVFALRPDQIRDKMRECADALRERLGGTSLDRVVDDAKAGRYHVRAEAPDELVAGLNLPPAWMRARARDAAAETRARETPHTPPRAAAVGAVAGSPGRKPMLRTPPSAKRRRVRAPAARAADETEPTNPDDPYAFEWREMGDAAEEGAAAEVEKKTRETPPPVGGAAARSPVTRVMNALLPWRRGGGGVGEDRGASPERSSPGKRAREEEDDEYALEDVMPTQAAPEEEEEAEPAPRGILSRMFSLGRRASPASPAPAAPAAPAALPAPPGGSPAASSPPSSPGRIQRTPRRTKEKKERKLVPLGKANRHSKRALKEGASPRPKERVRWTEEETEALRVGVEKWGKGKWREIYAENEALFASRERTLTDMKDRWRNVERSAGRPQASARDPAPVAEGGSPRWRRFLGFAADGGEDEDENKGPDATAGERLPREPGVANRHSAFRKKIGVDLGVRKPRQPFTAEEEEALEEGVALFGHHERDKWARILKHFDHIFVNRTSVDLKDKHRNMTKKRARDEGKAKSAAGA